jgi:hypothetical protein
MLVLVTVSVVVLLNVALLAMLSDSGTFDKEYVALLSAMNACSTAADSFTAWHMQ